MGIFSKKKKGDFGMVEIAKFGTYVLSGLKDGGLFTHLLVKSEDNEFALRIGMTTGMYEFLLAFISHRDELEEDKVKFVVEFLQAHFDLIQNIGTRLMDVDEMGEMLDVILKYKDKEEKSE